MGCWPVGTCFWDNFLLPSNIVRGPMSCQWGQCQRPDCPVSASDSQVADQDVPQVLEEQPFASSEMGESMDTDLLPELSGKTWVASTLLDGLTADLPPAVPIWTLPWCPVRTGRWRWFGSGSGRAMCPCGLIAQDFPQNYDVGAYNSVICPSIWMEYCGGVGPLHPGRLSWWFCMVNGGI